jgi:hypothetical protein
MRDWFGWRRWTSQTWTIFFPWVSVVNYNLRIKGKSCPKIFNFWQFRRFIFLSTNSKYHKTKISDGGPFGRDLQFASQFLHFLFGFATLLMVFSVFRPFLLELFCVSLGLIWGLFLNNLDWSFSFWFNRVRLLIFLIVLLFRIILCYFDFFLGFFFLFWWIFVFIELFIVAIIIVLIIKNSLWLLIWIFFIIDVLQ